MKRWDVGDAAAWQRQNLSLWAFFFFLLATLHGMWDLISPTRELNPHPLLWKGGVLTTRPPGKPLGFFCLVWFLFLFFSAWAPLPPALVSPMCREVGEWYRLGSLWMHRGPQG